jgi:hypothetical protein
MRRSSSRCRCSRACRARFPSSVTGLYLNSGRAKEGSWLSESDFKYILGAYVKHLKAGKTVGIRFFRAAQFQQRPQYVEWAKEILAGLEKPVAADLWANPGPTMGR